MLRATLKSLLSRKLRLVLSGLAVVLAVMFVSAAFVLGDTLGRSFDALFSDIYTNTEVQVTAKPKVDAGNGGPSQGTITADAVNQVRTAPGVRTATGQITVDGARVIGANGKVVPSSGAPRYGMSWVGTSTLIQLRDGRGPTATNEIAINVGLATSANKHVGDTATIITPFKPAQTFTIVGTFGFAGGRDSLGGETIVAFTEPVAQQLMLGQTGIYSDIDVKANPGTSADQLRDNVAAALGAGYNVNTGKDLAKQQAAESKKVTSAITWVLVGFAAVALLVGIFLIFNTFSIIVAQRTQELALLRALGASQPQVITSVLLESILVGAVASAIGFGIGIGLGAAGATALGSFAKISIASVGVPMIGLILSFTLGIGVTVLAALLPAMRASRVAPIAAMRTASTPDRPLTRLSIGGGAITLAGAIVLTIGLAGKAGSNNLWAILGGVLVIFIGVALLTPLLGSPLVSLLGRVFSWTVAGQLGRRNSARNPRRTAITAAALMIGIALVTGISTVFTSVSATLDKAVGDKVQADLIIAGEQTSAIPPAIDTETLTRIRGLSDVQAVAAGTYSPAMVNGKQQFVYSYDDIASVHAVLKIDANAGSIETLNPGQIIADDRVAKDQGLAIGSQVTVQLPRGEPKTYTLVGTYPWSVTNQGILLPWNDVATGFTAPAASQAFVKLRPGTSQTTAQKHIDQILAANPEVTVQTRDAYLKASTSIFDTFLTMVQVLLGIAMLIAVLGIVNTLLLSVIERTRELGLLRAIGLRRGQTMWMITVEAIVISVFGAMLGVSVGAGIGAAAVRALKDKGITELAFPWTLMAVYVAAAAIVGVLASIIPAIRAARLNVLSAISYE